MYLCIYVCMYTCSHNVYMALCTLYMYHIQCDLVQHHATNNTMRRGRMLANDNDMPYYETSAKQEGNNEIYKLFEKTVSSVCQLVFYTLCIIIQLFCMCLFYSQPYVANQICNKVLTIYRNPAPIKPQLKFCGKLFLQLATCIFSQLLVSLITQLQKV